MVSDLRDVSAAPLLVLLLFMLLSDSCACRLMGGNHAGDGKLTRAEFEAEFGALSNKEWDEFDIDGVPVRSLWLLLHLCLQFFVRRVS